MPKVGVHQRVQWNSETVRQWNSETVKQWISESVNQWNSVTVKQRNSVTVKQWNSKLVKQWNSDTVKQWNIETSEAGICNSACTMWNFVCKSASLSVLCANTYRFDMGIATPTWPKLLVPILRCEPLLMLKTREMYLWTPKQLVSELHPNQQ